MQLERLSDSVTIRKKLSLGSIPDGYQPEKDEYEFLIAISKENVQP